MSSHRLWHGLLCLVTALVTHGCKSMANSSLYSSAVSTRMGGVVLTHLTEPRFDTLFAAVEAAACTALPNSTQEDREHVGALLRMSDGRYGYLTGAGLSGVDRVRFSVRVPANSEVVALWHTHGAAGVDRDLFSLVDLDLVREVRVPLLLVTADGRVKLLSIEAARASRPQPGVMVGKLRPGRDTDCAWDHAVVTAFPNVAPQPRRSLIVGADASSKQRAWSR